MNVLIAEEFSRAADGGIGYTKAAGNYGAQFYPTALAQKQGISRLYGLMPSHMNSWKKQEL